MDGTMENAQPQQSDGDFDLHIVNGTLIDGNGTPGVRGDLAIRDGIIVAMGQVQGKAKRTIDAAGLAVTPGFIDIHTHYDAPILWDRMLTISPWRAVTLGVGCTC